MAAAKGTLERYCEDCAWVKWRGNDAICYWPVSWTKQDKFRIRRPVPEPIRSPCQTERAVTGSCGPNGAHWEPAKPA